MARNTHQRVIGIGNIWCGDDAFGPRVIDALLANGALAFEVYKARSEALELLELLNGSLRVLIIDAMFSDDHEAGDMVLFKFAEKHELDGFASTSHSTHGFGVFQLLRLCAALMDTFPSVYVLGVQGKDFSAGQSLSSKLEQCLSIVVNFLSQIEELDECMNMPCLKTCWPKSRISQSSIKPQGFEA